MSRLAPFDPEDPLERLRELAGVASVAPTQGLDGPVSVAPAATPLSEIGAPPDPLERLREMAGYPPTRREEVARVQRETAGGMPVDATGVVPPAIPPTRREEVARVQRDARGGAPAVSTAVASPAEPPRRLRGPGDVIGPKPEGVTLPEPAEIRRQPGIRAPGSEGPPRLPALSGPADLEPGLAALEEAVSEVTGPVPEAGFPRSFGRPPTAGEIAVTELERIQPALPPDMSDYTKTVLGALPRGALQTAGLGLQGIAELDAIISRRIGVGPEDATEYDLHELGRELREWSDRHLGAHPELRGTLWEAVPLAFGSAGGFILAGAAGGAPALVATGVGVGTGASAERARAAGGDVERAALLGGVVGSTEAVPFLGLFRRFRRVIPPGQISRLRRAATAGGGQMLEEGTQEAVAGVLYQGIAKLDDPDQELFENFVEEFGIGAAVGAVLGVGAGLIGRTVQVPDPETGETRPFKIEQAAFHIKGEDIPTGPAHDLDAALEGRPEGEKRTILDALADPDDESVVSGFVDSEGRFLDAETAQRLAGSERPESSFIAETEAGDPLRQQDLPRTAIQRVDSEGKPVGDPIIGRPGQLHGDLAEQNGIASIDMLGPNQKALAGFADERGSFLSREEAARQFPEFTGGRPFGAEDVREAGKLRGPEPRGAPDALPPGVPVPGPTGAEATVKTADGSQAPVRYRVVEADRLTTSHNAETFQRNPAFPEGVQERRYHDDPVAQQRVVETTQNLDPDIVLDPTPSAVSGPPIVLPDGTVLSGNQRTMAIARAYRGVPARAEAYRQAVAEQAERFGIDPAQVEGMERPVLVREFEAPHRDRAALAELSARFNETPTKARDPLADAAVRARRLREATPTLEHFAQTIEPDQTVRAYVETAAGREFVNRLVQTGTITRQEAARYIDKSGGLNVDGKLLVERMMQLAAVGDPEVVARTPAFALRKIERAAPALVRASTVEGWDLAPTLREALDLLAAVRAHPDATKVGEYVSQVDAFGRSFSDPATQLASVLESEGVVDVTRRFRAYAADAEAHARQTDTRDIFGHEPPGPEASFAERFDPETAPEEIQSDEPGRLRGPAAVAGMPESTVSGLEGPRRPESPGEAAVMGMPYTGQPISPEMTGRLEPLPLPGKPVSERDIIHQLANVVQVAGSKAPIRTGRVGRGRRGEFKVGPEVIRTRSAIDHKAAIHEVAHALQKQVFGFPEQGAWDLEMTSSTMQEELRKLGRELYGDRRPSNGYLSEGFAEYVRLWVTEPEMAKEKAPQFTKWVDGQFSEEYPEIWNALADARDVATRWREQGSVKRARASMVDPASVSARLRRTYQAVRRFASYENWIEQFQPLYEMAEEAEARLERKLEPEEDPYVTASALRYRHTARVRSMIEDGMIDFAGNRTGVQALEDIRGPVAKAPLPKKYTDEADRHELFAIYLWARRAVALYEEGRGRDPGISLEDARQVVEELESDHFETAARIVHEWNRGVLEYTAGRVDELNEAGEMVTTYKIPTFKRIMDQVVEVDPGAYIPLKREMDDLDSVWKGVSKSATRQSPVARLVGSTRRIKDPLQSMISQAEQMVRAAHERFVLDQVFRLAKEVDGLGHLVEKVSPDRAPVARRTVEQLLGEIEKRTGEEMSELRDKMVARDIAGELVTFFAPKREPGKKEPIIPIWDGEAGKVEWFLVSPEMYEALEGLGDIWQFDGVVNLLGVIPASMFRAGTTGLRAAFGLVTNPLRDIQTMLVNTRSKHQAFDPRLLGTLTRGMFESLSGRVLPKSMRSEFADAFIRLGGEMTQPLGEDIPQTRRAAKRLTRSPGRVAGLRVLDIRSPTDAYDAFRDLVQAPEAGPRIAEMRVIAEQVGWDPSQRMTLNQALQMSLASGQVTTDFTAAGHLARRWNRLVPFFNAAIQGPRANVRAFKRNPTRVAIAVLTLAVAGMANYWRNRDEDWYKELDYRSRYRYWWVPITMADGEETLIRIPRAFEIGTLAALPEAALESWYAKDPEAATRWAVSALEVATPPVMPVIPGVAAEQLANEVFYFDSPIVPRGEQRLPAEEQYGAYTTQASKKLGEIFNVSPRRIDHIREGILGRVSTDILEALDLVPGVTVGRTPPDQEKEAADIPVVGTLFKRGGRFAYAKSVDELYDELEEAQKRQASGRLDEPPRQRQLRLQLQDAARAISALSYVRQHTPAKKKRAAINEYIAHLAREALEDYRAKRVRRGRFRGERKRAEAEKKRVGQLEGPVNGANGTAPTTGVPPANRQPSKGALERLREMAGVR